MYSKKFLKGSIKLLSSPFPVMLQNFFTRRALKGHFKGIRRALGHSKHLGTPTLEALGHSKDTWVLWSSRHLGTRKVFGHLRTRNTQGTLFSRFENLF